MPRRGSGGREAFYQVWDEEWLTACGTDHGIPPSADEFNRRDFVVAEGTGRTEIVGADAGYSHGAGHSHSRHYRRNKSEHLKFIFRRDDW